MVTGAAGFIGFALLQKLSEDENNHVIAVDNFSRGNNDDAYKQVTARGNISSFNIDLSSTEDCKYLPNACDVIYHMAAMNGTQNFYERPYDVTRNCSLPTFNLIDKYVTSGVCKRFVYAGSSEAYASTISNFDWPVPTDENVPLSISDPTNTRWSYGGAKLFGEIQTFNACKQFKCDYTIIRYHNVYGPRMGDKHVIPDFLERMNNNVYELYGFKDTRSFMYIEDAVDATIALCKSKNARNEIVNVGNEKEVTILDLGELMMKLANVNETIELHDSPKGSVARRAPNTSKLKKLINYSEKWSLEDGLKKTMEFYLK